MIPYFQGWGSESKLMNCQYFSQGWQKTIDVLGLFTGELSIEKEFEVPLGSEQVEMSFSLVRNDWLPLNDFLMVEVAI